MNQELKRFFDNLTDIQREGISQLAIIGYLGLQSGLEITVEKGEEKEAYAMKQLLLSYQSEVKKLMKITGTTEEDEDPKRYGEGL